MRRCKSPALEPRSIERFANPRFHCLIAEDRRAIHGGSVNDVGQAPLGCAGNAPEPHAASLVPLSAPNDSSLLDSPASHPLPNASHHGARLGVEGEVRHVPANMVPVLDTARLRLRALRADDAAAIYAYGHDSAVTRFVSWPQHRSLDDASAFLKYAAEAVSSGREVQWALARRDDDALIGTAGVRLQGHRVELGYVMARPHWGRGYATEAATRIAEWALDNPGVVRVWAYCHVDNAASARVLEKTGMAREGRLNAWVVFPNLDGAVGDCWCYARVRR